MRNRAPLAGLLLLLALSAAGSEPATPDGSWWSTFGSEELDGLLRNALAANHDLAAATARIEQARASAKVVGADRWPEASVAGAAGVTGRTVDGSSVRTESGEVVLTAQVDVDLWGRAGAAVRAAQARVAASAHARAATELSLQAEVASNYFDALALRDRLRIAEANRDAAARLMALVQVRFDHGAATALEVAQQRTVLLGIEAGIPALRQSLREILSTLAVLLGTDPAAFDVSGRSLGALAPPATARTQPMALLERRPDVRSAEAELVAAGADVEKARAALYPTLGISLSAGVDGLLGGGGGLISSVLATLTQSIFDGGRRGGELAGARATHRELAENYAQTLLNARREATDSIAALANHDERAAVLANAVEQARAAHRLALLRYEAGAEDLLALLDSQRSLLEAEDTLVQTQALRFGAAVDLFAALGGGWVGAEA